MAPWSQFFSACAVGLLLFLACFLFWMDRGLKPVLARLRGQQVITAYLDAAITPAQEGKVVDSIRTSLGSQATHADVQVVSKEEFLKRLKQTYPDLGDELEALGGDTDSIVPRYVTVSGVLAEDSVNSVRAVPGISSAETSKDRNRSVVSAYTTLRWVARLLISGILMALFTGLIHLARMNSYLHQDTMQLMRLWGANHWQLRGPSLLSGLMVGLIGGVVASVGWVAAGGWVFAQMRTLSPIFRDMQIAHAATTIGLFVAGTLIGLLAGLCARPAPGASAEAGAHG